MGGTIKAGSTVCFLMADYEQRVINMSDSKVFSDADWKNETKLGNEYFSTKNYAQAHHHYKEAQALARQLFAKFKDAEPLPDGLTPILVISYLNLSEYWAEQGSSLEQKDFLLEIYNLLVKLLNNQEASNALYEQICQGLTKTYEEICRYFKSNNDLLALTRTRDEYMALISTGQRNNEEVIH